MRHLICSLAFGLSSTTASSSELVEAPEYNIEQFLNKPEKVEVSKRSLKGKVVILEFWATWCGPCIRAFDHINHLSDHYKGKDVVFISVTNQAAEKVVPFLEKKPLRTWVGLDTDSSLMKHFKFKSIPKTVLIDRDGNIAAITTPDKLNKKHIDTLLERKKLIIREPRKLKVKAGTDPLTGVEPKRNTVRFTKFSEDHLSYNRSQNGQKLTVLNADYDMLCSVILGLKPQYVKCDKPLKLRRFDIIINHFKEVDRGDIFKQIGYLAERKELQFDGLVLTRGKLARQNSVNSREISMKRVAKLLATYENKIIVDDSKLESIRLTGLPKKGIINGLAEMLVDQQQLIIKSRKLRHVGIEIKKMPEPKNGDNTQH